MFTNLIESSSHEKEFKRRGSFFLITVFVYALILSAAGIVSVYAYDAQLEAQTNSLELLEWVPPVTPDKPKPIPETQPAATRRPQTANAPVDRNVQVAERQVAIPPTNDPRVIPNEVGTVASAIPTFTGPVRISNRNVDPPTSGTGGDNCVACGTAPTVVHVEDPPPEPPPVKPPTTKQVTSQVLTSKAISVPQPPYPRIAKDTHTFGVVSVQILVDEQGKVISAHIVSGHPFLTNAARDAAMRARFTPTILNGQPVKIQGVITYNFVLQ